jgi:hypothetical protein
MAGLSARLLIASSLLAGLAGAAAAQPAPVGSLCNAAGKVEVFREEVAISCAEEPEQEMKALFKARGEYQGKFGLSPELKAQIDARIDRRIRELRKIKAAKKSA